MAKQTFTTGQVLTAAQMTSLQQTAMLGGDASVKVASYTLVAADAGTTVAMNSASTTTITVNTGLFAAGDTVFIQNRGAGVCTVTAGTATVASAGSLALPQNDAGILYFTSTSAATFYDFIQVGATSPLTTKGDLYGFSTSDQRIPIGANNTVLTADSTESLGLKWATASSGGMTLISETVASALSSLSFSSLGSHKQLILAYAGIRHSTTGSTFGIRLNNNSSANVYVTQQIGGSHTGSFSGNAQGDSQDSLLNGNQASWPFGENVTFSGVQTDCHGYIVIDNYASSTRTKTFTAVFGYYDNTAGAYKFKNFVGYFNSTTAITSLDIFRNSGSATFTNQGNTSIRLYGVS